MTSFGRLGFLSFATLLVACRSAPRAPPPATPPVPAPRETAPAPSRPTLPPVPLVEGPLDVRVVYPPERATITARDSNFILGSIGNGKGSLTINGNTVAIEPNGSFLAWLPVPPITAPVYEMVAVVGTDTVRATRRVGVLPPRKVLPDSGALVVDSASVAPRGTRVARVDEPVRVTVRAPMNAIARVQLADGRLRPLVNAVTRREGDSTSWSTDVPAGDLRRAGRVLVWRGADTVRLPISAIAILDSSPQFAMLGAARVEVPDTDRVVIARPVPGGTYKWFLLPGTVVEVTGRIGDAVRVRLDTQLEVWVDAPELRVLPPGSAAPRRVAGNARVVSTPEYVDVVIPTGERPPHAVRQEANDLVVTLYGTQATTDIINLPANDSLVRDVSWTQLTADRAEFRVRMTRPTFGYLVQWERNAFVLRVRRPPRVDREHPLRGLTIAVNAGHPPAGSTGPTGLYEAVPTLDISRKLAQELESRGARVVMVRTTPDPFPLALRPVVARRASAHAFVSIHLNALPDGVNPFTNHGTGTYYFNPHAEPLARAVQQGMVAAMGLRDLGINYDNLSDVRPTWMPMVLCEGAFIMIPEQEAAVRVPEFQEAYARGVADGLERYFRSLAVTP